MTSSERLYAQLPMWREIVCNTDKGAGEWSAALGKFNAANRMEVLLRLRGEPWLLSTADTFQAHEN